MKNLRRPIASRETDREWWKKGSLHAKTLKEWFDSSTTKNNKVATCMDFVASLVNKHPDCRISFKTPVDLMSHGRTLADQIDSVHETAQGYFTDDVTIAVVATYSAIMLGWIPHEKRERVSEEELIVSEFVDTPDYELYFWYWKEFPPNEDGEQITPGSLNCITKKYGSSPSETKKRKIEWDGDENGENRNLYPEQADRYAQRYFEEFLKENGVVLEVKNGSSR